jgi:hypothetical protein
MTAVEFVDGVAKCVADAAETFKAQIESTGEKLTADQKRRHAIWHCRKRIKHYTELLESLVEEEKRCGT